MSNPRAALPYAVAAYLSWGFLPIYFKALHGVPPVEILAHRVAWSMLLLSVLVVAMGRAAALREALGPGKRGALVASTLLIAVNWLLYIWAVQAGRVLEASLGYFINPLVNVLLGRWFLGERLTRRQAFAVGLAAAGVLALVIRQGTFPWVALVLALSFGSYGLVRKRAGIDPVAGLLAETALLAPFALGLLGWRAVSGTGAFGSGAGVSALLAAAGVITALPLVWFAVGVRHLRLSTMGIVQYLAPTGQFLLAVLLYREPFTAAHALAFGCIWSALGLYTWEALARTRVLVVEPEP
ncbi:MAG: EamA family transporter RarD [Anaeromyxobacter sp.]